MSEKPGFPAHSRVFWEARPNLGLPGWRRSADRASLQAISLLSGNSTGNFANLRHLKADADQETLCRSHLSRIPYSSYQGNYFGE
jgi:hypothetical protein